MPAEQPTLLTIYGYSDDLLMLAVNGEERDEVPIDPTIGGSAYRITGADGGLRVTGHYLDGGVWSIGVAPLYEDAALPPWPLKIATHHNGYSTRLTLECPTGVQWEAL
jgi:hypothetical protein